jgi:hypothetical protein
LNLCPRMCSTRQQLRNPPPTKRCPQVCECHTQ